jgi:hypothetical protein
VNQMRTSSAINAGSRLQTVHFWTAVGALAAAFEVYLLVHWVTSADFTAVPSGPSILPAWMKVTIWVCEVVLPLVAIATIYGFMIRPWRRTGRLTLDGALCLAFGLSSIYDPLSEYVQNWYAYNSFFINRVQ